MRISEYIENITEYFKYYDIMYYIKCLSPAILPAVLFFFATYMIQRKKNATLQKRFKLVNSMISSIHLTKGIENNLNDILGIISSLLPASTFSFYIYDEKKELYVLRSVRNKAGHEEDQIAPSYSGLLPFKKEEFLPPVSVNPDPLPDKASIINEGNVPLLIVPIKGGKGLVYSGPISHRVPSRVTMELDLLSDKLQPFLEMLIENEKMKKQVELIVSSGKAMHNISSMVLDDEAILSSLLGISSKTINASGAFFLKRDKDNECSVMSSIGLDNNAKSLFLSDFECHSHLFELLGSNSIVVLRKGEKEYFSLPSYFSVMGMEMLVLVNACTGFFDGLTGFWYYDNQAIEDFRISAIVMLSGRMAEIIENQINVKGLSSLYINMLKSLAQMMDSLNPHTVGYSELMCRYAAIVAKEMELGLQEIKEISLAAYLSNIGVLGLSSDLIFKEGKYSELEYEMMKLHSDVGASIIEATIANQYISSCIRHHHERIDGFGYPLGLKGDEIPVGARIIAVVQTFIAKISGRKNRDPLPFKKTLEMLKAVAGSQLDPEIVNILINWFKKKQAAASRENFSLGPCWEMICPPESICLNCPAYKNTVKNCWEYTANNCEGHGNKCGSCYVHTEFESRSKISVYI